MLDTEGKSTNVTKDKMTTRKQLNLGAVAIALIKNNQKNSTQRK